MKAGDSIGVDVHLCPRVVPGQEEPDMVYKPVIRPLMSRDLTSLSIELDILGKEMHAKR